MHVAFGIFVVGFAVAAIYFKEGGKIEGIGYLFILFYIVPYILIAVVLIELLLGAYFPSVVQRRNKFISRLGRSLFNRKLRVPVPFHCLRCNKVLLFTYTHCPSCGEEVPVCVFCRLPINESSPAVVYTCCNTYSHRSHVRSWYLKNSACPYCQTRHAETRKVQGT